MSCVLYIEDTDDVRLVKKEGLESRGFKVLAAESPKEAIQLAEDNRDEIDVILLDIMMPPQDLIDPARAKQGYMTGYHLIPLLNDKLAKELPIVVQSSYSDLRDLARIRSHPQVKTLVDRSTRIDALAEVIKEAISL